MQRPVPFCFSFWTVRDSVRYGTRSRKQGDFPVTATVPMYTRTINDGCAKVHPRVYYNYYVPLAAMTAVQVRVTVV